jgi:hypothetical protein
MGALLAFGDEQISWDQAIRRDSADECNQRITLSRTMVPRRGNAVHFKESVIFQGFMKV